MSDSVCTQRAIYYIQLSGPFTLAISTSTPTNSDFINFFFIHHHNFVPRPYCNYECINHASHRICITVYDLSVYKNFTRLAAVLNQWHQTVNWTQSSCCYHIAKRLRWSTCSVLAFGTQVRGFKPGRSRRGFQGEKILSTPSFGRAVKPFVPCRRFMTCKRSLNVTWKSGIFRQTSSAISHPSSSSFHY